MGLFIIFAKYTKIKNEMSEIIFGLYLKFFSTAFTITILYFITKYFLDDEKISILLVFLNDIVSNTVEARINISLGSFLIRIS